MRLGERGRTVVRASAWVAWLGVLLLAPAAVEYLAATALIAPIDARALPPFSMTLPWSLAMPLSLVAAALSYALRGALPWRRHIAAAGALALLAYLAVDAARPSAAYADLPLWALSALALCERPLRYAAWALWGAALGAWVAPGEAARPASPLEGLPGAEALSEREREIAEALVSGCTPAQVAESLAISASTVATYRARACEKLGVASIGELVTAHMGAAAVPPSLGVDGPMALPLMVAALCLGSAASLFAELVVRGGSAGVDLVSGLLLALFVIGPWAALLAYARATGMVVRGRRLDGSLAGVLLALAVLGLCLGASSYGIAFGGVGLRLSVLLLPVHAVAVAALAPYLLWPRDGEEATLDVDRCVLYLRGRGAGELQAHVLTEIALGRSAPEICERLHVARGTVNAYRAQGYERLRVHSSRELHDLLVHDVGMVPSADKNRPSADGDVTTE